MKTMVNNMHGNTDAVIRKIPNILKISLKVQELCNSWCRIETAFSM